MDGKLIISLTSYPARINCVPFVLRSVLHQGVDYSLFNVVLVLAEPEFPNKEADLPRELTDILQNYNNVEILWYGRNILSHKKLMPTLAKYPNNPILVIDDDAIRPLGWLKMFINDHKKYPNDILAGVFAYEYDESLRMKFIKSTIHCKGHYDINDKPGVLMMKQRPANGLGGTLYPVGTFTDPRFFDQDLMMEMSPTSDESWQFMFNVIEGRTIRQTSLIYDYSKFFIQGTQNMETCLFRSNNYVRIFSRLYENFPEFKTALKERVKQANINNN